MKLLTKIISDCLICKVYRLEKAQAKMGFIEEESLMFTSAMSVITVDNAGPFLLKVHSHSKQKMKFYVLICVCAATGLIQYLLQEDLTPRAFLNCVAILKSRFGPIRKISLDPAGCFIAAEKAVNASQNSFGDDADFMNDAMGVVADAAQK